MTRDSAPDEQDEYQEEQHEHLFVIEGTLTRLGGSRGTTNLLKELKAN